MKDIENILKETLAELLQTSADTLDRATSFNELNISSVMAVEYVETLRVKLGIALGVEVMFDYRDIRELAAFIVQHAGKENFSQELPPLVSDAGLSEQEYSRSSARRTLVSAITKKSRKKRKMSPKRRNAIAIIGMSGKFADSPHLASFWSHLQAGESCIKPIRRQGWEINTGVETSSIKWGGMLEQIDQFDPLFFNISPLEAARMDPQQRLFLQEAYQAFEDAGYCAEQLSGKSVGVFVGARAGDYQEQALLHSKSGSRFSEMDSHLFLGNDMAILAARISYFLNCKGPSLTIDTACSSSLVAVHLACESLRTGESEMALAGGVFVLSSPAFSVMSANINTLSPDGICRTFDDAANGMVIGEGVGAVVLKPLEAALADGDHIHGVILGSAMNQDGRTKGITAPSQLAQKALLISLYKKAEVAPETMSYIEAHGTGTKLGDPIEMKALSEAFRQFTDATQFCAVGSLKPNMGHTIMAAGIAGLLKVLLAMKYQQIPPTINVEQVNQQIDCENSPFFINTELRAWSSSNDRPRRAGISSFGFSGTNCHAIIEEPPAQKKRRDKPNRLYYFFPLSARTKAALRQKVADLAQWLAEEGAQYAIADIAYTLAQGRSHFPLRTAVVASNTKDLLHALRSLLDTGGSHDSEESKPSQIEPALQAYAQQLLQQLQESAALTPEEYKERLLALADLYRKGYAPDWGALFAQGSYQRVPLPTYPFQGASYWMGNIEPQSLSLMDSLIDRFHSTNQHVQAGPLDAETRLGLQQMDELLSGLLWSTLQPLGLFKEKQVVLTQLREEAGISVGYERWLQQSVALLERQGYPASIPDGSTSIISDSAMSGESSSQLWQRWDEHKERWMPSSNLKARVVLVEAMLRALPSILTGKRPATEVMFPRGSLHLVEGFYQHNAIADYFNEVLARFLTTYLQERRTRDREARVRILEIGAGTGGTTNRVLQVLQPHRTMIAEYCYSDISPAFLHDAQQRYGETHPYLTYHLFNVEKPPIAQGIAAASYDVVIATNVLHATSNMRSTMRNVRATLKEDGLLLLNEITDTSLFMHLTFGLLAGWWAYGDPELRMLGSPALNVESWQAVLSGEGFGTAFLPAQQGREVGQQVIVATAVAQPPTGQPSTGQSSTGQSSIGQPSIGQPSIGQPSIGQPSTGQSSTGQPPTGQPPTGQPPTGQPPTGQPQGIAPTMVRSKPATDDSIIVNKLHKILAQVVSDLLRVPVDEIDYQTEFSEYGFDSITLLKLANRLNETYQFELTPPLFYEYSTIEHLARYLQATYAMTLAQHFTGISSPMRDQQVMPATSELALKTTDEVRQIETSSLATTPSVAHSSVAIVGISGCFPQAPDVESLWDNLLAGRDCIGEIPPSRWNWPSYADDKMKVKWAGIVPEVELFDPLFFGISPAEAEQMDPQQRLLMMYVWKAIEDAGYSAASISGSDTALFFGTMSSGYSERLLRAGAAIEGYTATGQASSVGPNRMSYFLNVHGPSEAIETACSSSLVAIHRGVHAIQSGACSMAIVGGINTLVSPELHMSYTKAGMLASDGRCKTFSAAANGYVRGEGVGVLVLKKLSDAEQAGDHIYGVIRGSAENHGGRANSLTAPNPRAQADLLMTAYRKAGIDPRTVSYIEAHGTGTALGDPIEINGLKTAFSELVKTMGNGSVSAAWCGIGSLKSNIGHLEWAAGVAGVIKVLLQMQHKKLVKSLHCEQINPYIQLDGSPFYIVQQTRDWDAQHDELGNVLSRRAGISSFGFGGVNTHVVLEEYVPPQRHGWQEQAVPPLIVLSAKNEERLHLQVRQLLDWVQANILPSAGHPQGMPLQWHESSGEGCSYHCRGIPCGCPALLDLAYTLQVGREPMEERLALRISSLAELAEKLRTFLQAPQMAGDWYRGRMKQHKELVTFLGDDEEWQELATKWLQRGKYEKILEGWVKGLAIDWFALYKEQKPHRISLPTYPFAQERYWPLTGVGPRVDTASRQSSSASVGGTTQTMQTVLHPLVHYNNSDFFEQRFSSTFHGEQFWLADHRVLGQRMIPAVAYLEMARAALDRAMRGTVQQEGAVLSLKHIVWARPLVVDEQPATVHIVLQPQEHEGVSFLITDDAHRDGEQASSLLCQGKAQLQGNQAVAPAVELAAVQSRCRRKISATECYQSYQRLGLSYGPAHQGIEQLLVGEQEALARLSLPAAVAQTHTDFVLHPSVLDAALQACIGLLAQSAQPPKLQVPFALEEISIMGEVPAQGWAWVRCIRSSMAESVFDIDMCDDQGHSTIRLRGLSTRRLHSAEETRTALLIPSWRAEPIVPLIPQSAQPSGHPQGMPLQM